MSEPLTLKNICDAKTIGEIGAAYRKKEVSDTNEAQLVRLLLTDTEGKTLPHSSDSLFIRSVLENKIKQDFEKDRIIILKGWVLSLTEARQCALFSLIR